MYFACVYFMEECYKLVGKEKKSKFQIIYPIKNSKLKSTSTFTCTRVPSPRTDPLAKQPPKNAVHVLPVAYPKGVLYITQ